MFQSYCRVTGHSRNLPRPNYYPILPPISPAEAKRYRTTSCRITCNFNPNHNYKPITNLIVEAVVKCRITEKSVYEYKYFVQPFFGDIAVQNGNHDFRGGSSEDEFYYYELEDKILVLPKSVEQELNRGVIRDVHISEENNKIGFKYLNRITEYDLVSQPTEKLKEISPLKGQGLRRNGRRKRKKSTIILGDLMTLFEEKEKLAEIEFKKAIEKIQPDSGKMELIKSKITSSKAPVFGYIDHNNKFTEVHSVDEIPKHVTKGQMQSGIFTPGELIHDAFIPGKHIDNTFTPGIIKDNLFVPGSFIEKEVNGKAAKKFIPGKMINGVFTPGQMCKTSDGTRSEFIPGQVLTLENNVKKFVPGLLIEHVENDTLDLQFVPGTVEETVNGLKFIPGELIETNEGLKFICEKVFTDSFEVQTFDNDFDFDLEDVKSAAAVCDTLHDFVRPDDSSVDVDPPISFSHKASTIQEVSSEVMLVNQMLKKDTQKASVHKVDGQLSDQQSAETTFTENHETLKQSVTSAVQKVCSDMKMTQQETAQAVEKVLEGLSAQQLQHSSASGKIDTDTGTLFQTVQNNVTSTLKQIFSDHGEDTCTFAIETVLKAVEPDVVKLVKGSKKTVGAKKKTLSDQTIPQIQSILNDMNLTKEESIQAMEQILSHVEGDLGAGEVDLKKIKLSVSKTLMEFFAKGNNNKLDNEKSQKAIGKIMTIFTNPGAIKLLDGDSSNKVSVKCRKVSNEKALCAIEKMLSGMNLTKKEKTLAIENILQEFEKQDILETIGEPDGSLVSFENVKNKAAAAVKQVLSKISKVQLDNPSTQSTIQQLIEECIAPEVIHFEVSAKEGVRKQQGNKKMSQKAQPMVQNILAEMHLQGKEMEQAMEKIMQELDKEESLEQLSSDENIDPITKLKKMKKKISTTVKQVFKDMKIDAASPKAMETILEKCISSESVLKLQEKETKVTDTKSEKRIIFQTTQPVVEKMLSAMNLTEAEKGEARTKIMEELEKQAFVEVKDGGQNLQEKISSSVKKVMGELKEDSKQNMALMDKVLKECVTEDMVAIVENQMHKITKKDKQKKKLISQKAAPMMESILAEMSLKQEDRDKIMEKMLQEFENEELVGEDSSMTLASVQAKVSKTIDKVCKEMKVKVKESPAKIQSILEACINQESVEKLTIIEPKTIQSVTGSQAVKPFIQGIVGEMNLSPGDRETVINKMLEEFGNDDFIEQELQGSSPAEKIKNKIKGTINKICKETNIKIKDSATKMNDILESVINDSTLGDLVSMQVVGTTPQQLSTQPIVENILSNMNMSQKDKAKVMKMFLEEFDDSKVFGQELNGLDAVSKMAQVQKAISSTISKVCQEINIDIQESPAKMQKILESCVNENIVCQLAKERKVGMKSKPQQEKGTRVSQEAQPLVESILAEMNLSKGDKEKVMEQIIQAMANESIFNEHLNNIDPSIKMEKIKNQIANTISKACKDSNVQMKETPAKMQKILASCVNQQVIGQLTAAAENDTLATSIQKSKRKTLSNSTKPMIENILSDLNLPEKDREIIMEKMLLEMNKGDFLEANLTGESSPQVILELMQKKVLSSMKEVISSSNMGTPEISKSMEKAVKKHVNKKTVEKLEQINKATVLEVEPPKLSDTTHPVIQEILSHMTLTNEEKANVIERLMTEFDKEGFLQNELEGSDPKNKLEMVKQAITNKVFNVFSEMKIDSAPSSKQIGEILDKKVNAKLIGKLEETREEIKDISENKNLMRAKLSSNAKPLIQSILSEMKLSKTDEATVMEKLLDDLIQNQGALDVTEPVLRMELMKQNISLKVKEVFTEMNIKGKSSKIDKILDQCVTDEAMIKLETENLKVISSVSRKVSKVKSAKQCTESVVENILSEMNLTKDQKDMAMNKILADIEKHHDMALTKGMDPTIANFDQVKQQISSSVKQIFKEMKVDQNPQAVEKILDKCIRPDAIQLTEDKTDAIANTRKTAKVNKLSQQSQPIVESILSEMNLTSEEKVIAMEKILKQLDNKENICNPLTDSGFENVKEAISSTLKQVLVEMKVDKQQSSVDKILEKCIKPDKLNTNVECMVVRNTKPMIENILSEMRLTDVERETALQFIMKEMENNNNIEELMSQPIVNFDFVKQNMSETIREALVELGMDNAASPTAIQKLMDRCITKQAMEPEASRVNAVNIKSMASPAVDQILSGMNLSKDEQIVAKEKILKELSSPDLLQGNVNFNNMVDVQKILSSKIKDVFSEMKLEHKVTSATIQKSLEQNVQPRFISALHENAYTNISKDLLLIQNSRPLIQTILSEMVNLSSEEKETAMEQILQEFQNQDRLNSTSFETVKEQISSTVKQVLTQMKVQNSTEELETILNNCIKPSAVKSLTYQAPFSENGALNSSNKWLESTQPMMEKILSEMHLTKSEKLQVMEKVMQEFSNQTNFQIDLHDVEKMKKSISSTVQQVFTDMNLDDRDNVGAIRKILDQYVKPGEILDEMRSREFPDKQQIATISSSAQPLVEKMLSEMHLTNSEKSEIMHKIMEEFSKNPDLQIDAEKVHSPTVFEKIKSTMASTVRQVLVDCSMDKRDDSQHLEKIFEQCIKPDEITAAVQQDHRTSLKIVHLSEKVSSSAEPLVEKILAEMNLTGAEKLRVMERIMDELDKKDELQVQSAVVANASEFEKIKQSISSTVRNVFKEMNVQNGKESPALQCILDECIKPEGILLVGESNKPLSQVKIKLSQKISANAQPLVEQILGEMHLNEKEKTEAMERILAELHTQSDMQINANLLSDSDVFNKVKQAIASTVQKVVSDIGTGDSLGDITLILERCIRPEAIKPVENKATRMVENILAQMNMTLEEQETARDKILEHLDGQESFVIQSVSSVSSLEKVQQQIASTFRQVFTEMSIIGDFDSIDVAVERSVNPNVLQSIQNECKGISSTNLANKAMPVVEELLSRMSLTKEQKAEVIEKITREFSMHEVVETPGFALEALMNFENIRQAVSSTMQKVFSEINSVSNNEASEMIEIILAECVNPDVTRLREDQLQDDLVNSTIAANKYKHLSQQALPVIQTILANMDLSEEETADAIEKIMQEFVKQDILECGLNDSGICSARGKTTSAGDNFQAIKQKASSAIQQVFSDMKLMKKARPAVDRILREFDKQDILKYASTRVDRTEIPYLKSSYEKMKQKPFMMASTATDSIMNVSRKQTSSAGSIGRRTLMQEMILQETLSVLPFKKEVEKKRQHFRAAMSEQCEEIRAKTATILQQVTAQIGPSTHVEGTRGPDDLIFSPSYSNRVRATSRIPGVHTRDHITLGGLIGIEGLLGRRYLEMRVNSGGSLERSYSPSLSSENILLKECKRLLRRGYNHDYYGDSEEEAADMLKGHVETDITKELNRALLLEALNLARILGKIEVVKELELIFENESSFETVVNDDQVHFILMQLVILKKLMAFERDRTGESLDLNENQGLIRDAQILTEFVFANEERGERLCGDQVRVLGDNNFPPIPPTVAKNPLQRDGVSVYMEESASSFFSEGTAHAKRARLNIDDPDFDIMSDPVELLDSSFARHKIELGRSRHQKKSKISLKSADELQSTTSEQLALINREATLRELIETEEEFVRDLNFVIENYYKALGTGNKLAKYRDLFGSLKPIYEFHQGILLEGFRYYMNEPKMIGRTFLRLERYFDNHAEYISEEEPNAQALLKDDMEISEYFEELTLSLDDEKSLSDHLKLPLQRINDYQLILQDLIDTQRILKEEITDLEKALDLLLSIPQKISDKKFLSNIEGFHGNVFHLGRLLRHDWFTVTREDVEEVKQRYAFLFKTRILLTKVRKISEERSVFILKDIIKLPEYQLEQVDDNKFILRGDNKRVYIFETQTGSVSSEWTDYIQQILQPDQSVPNLEESRELRREGSLRKSQKQTSQESKKLLAGVPISKKFPEETAKSLAKGVIIQELSLEEAEKLEQKEIDDIKSRSNLLQKVSSTKTQEQHEKVITHKIQLEGEKVDSENTVAVEVKSATVQPTEVDCTTVGPTKVELSKVEATKAEATKLESSKVEGTKAEATKVESSKVEGTKAEATKVESYNVEGTKAEATRVESSNFEGTKAEATKVESSNVEGTKAEATRVESSNFEGTKAEATKVESSNVEGTKAEATRVESSNFEGTKAEATKAEATKVESSKVEATKLESSKVEATKTEAAKVESSKVEAIKVEASKVEASKVKSAQINSSSPIPTESSKVTANTKASSVTETNESVSLAGTATHEDTKLNSKGNASLKEANKGSKQIEEKPTESSTDSTGIQKENTSANAEDQRQLKRRSSVIRRQSSVAMPSEKPPVFVTPLRSVECEPGDNASFECVTEVPVIITWLKGNRPLDDALADRVKITSKENKHSLILLNCRDEDSGLYTAKITDDKFAVATSSAVLTVHELTAEERAKKIQEKNSPQFIVKFKDTELLKDTRVSFMFVVKGKPDPVLTFLQDGMVISDNERRKIVKHPDDMYELCVDKMSEEDAGEYTVKAENKYGTAEATARVSVVDEKELFKGIEGKRLLNPGEEPVFDWFLNGRPFTPDEKLKVLFREDEDTLALVFKHVTPDDAGLYTCVAQTSGGKISCSAELTVQGAVHQLLKEPSAPVITAELTDTEVSVGGSAMMELKVTGFPKPQVTWYKNGKDELLAGGRFRFLYEDDESIALIIKNVTKEDAGLYVVKAVNDIGEAETKAQLIVKAPPRFVKKMVDMACMTEEKLAMEVVVEGSPKPEVKWYKDGQLIIASERIKFTELEDGRFQITIERVTLEDSGAYSVVASNAIGQMSEFWNLVAQQPAKIIRKLPADFTTDLGTKGNQINFSVQGAPEPAVSCATSSGKILKVDNLGGGEYRVNFDCTEREDIKVKAEAKNDFGTDTSECQVNVRRSVKITSQLTDIEVKEGEDVTLKVKVDSYPKPSKVRWFIDGVEISGKKYETTDSGNEYALKIKSVEKKEASNKLKVQVKVENELGQDECSASVTIKSKPSIKKGLEAKYRLLESSTNQELTVEVDSATFPEPKGKWFHNGVEVEADARIKITKKSSETYHLSFNVIKYEDAGEWSFKAENEVGEVWSKTTVIVEGKPTFRKGLPEILEVIESEKMELNVMVQDFCEENTKITWTLDSGVKLESNEVYDQSSNSAVSKIVLVPKSGYQKLTVTATNKHGDTETRSELVQVNLVPPTIKKPLEKEVSIKDGQKDVILKVEVDGQPYPKIVWSKNGEVIQQDTDELRIPVFSASNLGQYSVQVSNVAGKANTEGSVKMLQTKPSFLSGLEPAYEFKEGLEDLVLTVAVDGSPIPTVVWLKDGQPIDMNDPRVSVTNADGKSTLRVKNIDPKDKGKYSVTLKNPNGLCDASTNVVVKPTPRAPILMDPLEYPRDVNRKGQLEIKTKIDGEPMPAVMFYHNGSPLKPSQWKVHPDGSVILTIDNVQPEHQGVYSIQLENEVGEKKVDTEPINIHEPPQRPGIDPPLSAQRVVEGLPLLIKASIKGHPAPELKLEKDGVEVKDVVYDKDAKTFEYSKPSSLPSDSGTYKLIVKNAQGQVESEGKIDVVSRCKDGPKYEPKFLYELCDKTVNEGNELTLFAKVDGNPLPSVQWEFNGSPINPEKFAQTFDGEKATLRLAVAGRDDQGLYKCVLKNEEGTVESGANVVVNKIYKPPSFAQKFTDQEQIPACDCKFGARVSGIPIPRAQWFKDGTEILPSDDKYRVKQEGDVVQLHVRNCNDGDRGIYTCRLTNSQGTAECKAKLDVVKEISHKPRSEIPYFLKTIGNTEVYPGMSAKFTACVGGFPDPEFEWFRNGNEKVYESDRIKFERDGAGSGLIRLIIKDVDIGDLADYTLRIWNAHGDAECSAYLKYDSLADLNKQKLGDLYSGYEDTKPTAIPNRPLITRMTDKRMTLKWTPCLPHVSRIPCAYLVEMCPVDEPDNWSTLYKGLKNNYCDVDFPNPNKDYKFRIRVQWGQHHVSEPSPYAITMRNKFDTRPPQWKPVLVPSIPRSYDLSRPPHDGYTHPPRFLNKEKDSQYAQLGHSCTLYYYVYGYPKPTLKFFKNGQEFHPEHTYMDNGLISIFINRMTEDWEGDYECEAKNSIGIARQPVTLKRADHPRFITRPEAVHVLSRRSGKISARIYGIPVPDIRIYKDWHPLPLTMDTRIRLQVVDVDSFTIDVFVYLEEALMRDEGLYSIVATNVAGSVHSSAMIHMEESEHDYYFNSNLKGKDVRFRNLNIRNYYDFGDELGRGTQGVHHHVVERSSGSSYISKTMITRYDPRRKEWVESEYNIWNGLNHRHITRLHDAFYHDDTYTFVSDICTGGDILYNFISRDMFTEYDVCYFIRQILLGLEYLHVQNHTAHLSLTPLDLLLTHINSDTLRIIDFGLARKSFNRTLEYGHPEYVSPEIVRGEKNVGPWCDMWSVGIITYVLLTGHSPFLGLNDRETLENVKNGAWTFGERFEGISERAMDFIKRLLVYDFKDRMDIQKALDHQWFHLITEDRTSMINLQRDSHSSYYYKLKAWNENASCRGIYRRNPLETAYKDPSKMVYPPNYIEDDDYKAPIPSSNHLKLDGYARPDAGDFVNESHYQSGDETYLLQLRDPDFPARLRQYMKVAAHHSPSFQFQVYNDYCERNLPTIRERRKFTDIMDEEVDDERKSRISNYGEGPWNSEPRRLRHEVGTRLDSQAEADAIISMRRDGREPVFRVKPDGILNVRVGQEVELKVFAGGDPAPSIQWFKNDMMVLSTGENREIEADEEGHSTFRFKEVRETDLTVYKIVARNKAGQMVSRFRLRVADEPRGDESVPELNYDHENSPVHLTTEEVQIASPVQVVYQGQFNSVVLAENSRLLKVCTQQEFDASRKFVHRCLFSVEQAAQIGAFILAEDNLLTYSSSCNLLQYISSLDLYSEQLICLFVAQVLDGLQYLHWQGIALLNLEPGNVLVFKDKKIKLTDFSAAQPVLKIGSRVDCLTDPQFTAPEVLNGESQCIPQTDTWNVGLLIYILLSGVSPFLADTEEETKQNVTYVRFRFEHLHKTVSQEVTRFIMLLFKRSPLKRPTADECLEHRWFQLTDHMTKKREKAFFDTVKIKEYYANYLAHQKAKESNLQDFIAKYGTPIP